jgi:hypothetical protein
VWWNPPSVQGVDSVNHDHRNKNMDCLICGANAEKIPTAITDISILCPTCGEYDVSGMVIATGELRILELRQRREMLDKARRSARPDTRPMITTYLFD